MEENKSDQETRRKRHAQNIMEILQDRSMSTPEWPCLYSLMHGLPLGYEGEALYEAARNLVAFAMSLQVRTQRNLLIELLDDELLCKQPKEDPRWNSLRLRLATAHPEKFSDLIESAVSEQALNKKVQNFGALFAGGVSSPEWFDAMRRMRTDPLMAPLAQETLDAFRVSYPQIAARVDTPRVHASGTRDGLHRETHAEFLRAFRPLIERRLFDDIVADLQARGAALKQLQYLLTYGGKGPEGVTVDLVIEARALNARMLTLCDHYRRTEIEKDEKVRATHQKAVSEDPTPFGRYRRFDEVTFRSRRPPARKPANAPQSGVGVTTEVARTGRLGNGPHGSSVPRAGFERGALVLPLYETSAPKKPKAPQVRPLQEALASLNQLTEADANGVYERFITAYPGFAAWLDTLDKLTHSTDHAGYTKHWEKAPIASDAEAVEVGTYLKRLIEEASKPRVAAVPQSIVPQAVLPETRLGGKPMETFYTAGTREVPLQRLDKAPVLLYVETDARTGLPTGLYRSRLGTPRTHAPDGWKLEPANNNEYVGHGFERVIYYEAGQFPWLENFRSGTIRDYVKSTGETRFFMEHEMDPKPNHPAHTRWTGRIFDSKGQGCLYTKPEVLLEGDLEKLYRAHGAELVPLLPGVPSPWIEQIRPNALVDAAKTASAATETTGFTAPAPAQEATAGQMPSNAVAIEGDALCFEIHRYSGRWTGRVFSNANVLLAVYADTSTAHLAARAARAREDGLHVVHFVENTLRANENAVTTPSLPMLRASQTPLGNYGRPVPTNMAYPTQSYVPVPAPEDASQDDALSTLVTLGAMAPEAADKAREELTLGPDSEDAEEQVVAERELAYAAPETIAADERLYRAYARRAKDDAQWRSGLDDIDALRIKQNRLIVTRASWPSLQRRVFVVTLEVKQTKRIHVEVIGDPVRPLTEPMCQNAIVRHVARLSKNWTSFEDDDRVLDVAGGEGSVRVCYTQQATAYVPRAGRFAVHVLPVDAGEFNGKPDAVVATASVSPNVLIEHKTTKE